MKHVITIAGSDSSGGAGIQADLKTFSALGVFGMSAITAVTAQSTRGVFAVNNIPSEIILKQLEVIFEDIKVDGLKIGMVSNTETISTLTSFLKKHPNLPIVLDPVMISKSGFHLLESKAESALIKMLIPLATLVTPNIPEAEVILQEKISSVSDMKKAGEKIHKLGPKYVLMKGGHLEGQCSTDLLFDGKTWHEFSTKRMPTKNTHGTGCTLSAAICANIAKGHSIEDSVAMAKDYVTKAIKWSFSIGQGPGPLHHFHAFYNLEGQVHNS